MAKKINTNKKVKKQVKSKKNISINNFGNYNQVRRDVSVYLKSKGIKYNLQEFNGYVNGLYGSIKLKAKGSAQISRALQNIDVFISDYFTPSRTISFKIDQFEWWTIQDVINTLPAQMYVIVDNTEVVGKDEYEGTASGYSNLHSEFVRNVNSVCGRKEYAYYMQ